MELHQFFAMAYVNKLPTYSAKALKQLAQVATIPSGAL